MASVVTTSGVFHSFTCHTQDIARREGPQGCSRSSRRLCFRRPVSEARRDAKAHRRKEARSRPPQPERADIQGTRIPIPTERTKLRLNRPTPLLAPLGTRCSRRPPRAREGRVLRSQRRSTVSRRPCPPPKPHQLAPATNGQASMGYWPLVWFRNFPRVSTLLRRPGRRAIAVRERPLQVRRRSSYDGPGAMPRRGRRSWRQQPRSPW